jgi:hypothetical protein
LRKNCIARHFRFFVLLSAAAIDEVRAYRSWESDFDAWIKAEEDEAANGTAATDPPLLRHFRSASHMMRAALAGGNNGAGAAAVDASAAAAAESAYELAASLVDEAAYVRVEADTARAESAKLSRCGRLSVCMRHGVRSEVVELSSGIGDCRSWVMGQNTEVLG